MSNVVFTEWHPMAVIQMAKRASRRNLEKASQMLIDKIRESMRESKSGRTYYVWGGKHTASAPGESPAVMSQDLYDALEYKIIETGSEIISRIGVDVDNPNAEGYASWLELGTSTMQPRPYLRSTLFQNEAEIRRILNA